MTLLLHSVKYNKENIFYRVRKYFTVFKLSLLCKELNTTVYDSMTYLFHASKKRWNMKESAILGFKHKFMNSTMVLTSCNKACL